MSVLEACGREYGARVEVTAYAMGEPNPGAVLRAAMAVAVSGLDVDAPLDVVDDVDSPLDVVHDVARH